MAVPIIIGATGGVGAARGRSLAAEWAPQMWVNVIAPSLIRTGMAAPLLASEQLAQGIAAMHPIQRRGEAEDQAAAASFLLLAEAGWITGQVLGVDGGRATLRNKE